MTRLSSALLDTAFSRTRAPVRQVLRRVVEEPTERLKFLPDCIVEEHTWWVDAEGDFSTEGGVKATTVFCDSSATSGAVLFDAAWTSEREMGTALLEYTKKIVARPEQGRIPGWVSVAGALGFLKANWRCARARFALFRNPRVWSFKLM